MMAFENYLIHLGILVCIYSILAISLDFALGFCGLLNLGHIAFMGIGAYASAILTLAGIPWYFSMLLAAAFAAAFGFLLSIPTMRLKGDYLALIALGFTFIMGSVARNWTSLTRGALGIPGIPRIASTNLSILIFCLASAALTYLIFKAVANSRFGKACQAIRDDELAAKTLGIDSFWTKAVALTLSAFFAGLAGSLYAHYITFIDPSIFGLNDMVLLLSMVIVGGLASPKGAYVGAAILLLLPEPLRFIGFPSWIIGPAREMIFALLLLLILLSRPKGIFGKVSL